MMLMLGRYRFSLDTAAYEGKSRETRYRWGEQARLVERPALQFIGPGEDKLDIDGIIYPYYRGGLGQLETLRREAGRGEPLLLVEGTGKVLGRWVIDVVRENQRTFAKDGTPAAIRFSLTLRKHQAGRNSRVNDWSHLIRGQG
ncbi:phage tail protein [Veronia pacifica]|uniref:Phage tail protein n=1 Tax=Veronia pacifica TaxID=1080227 RepID=A0A1C3ELB9_9GAMM|nr:phage tail protein [Veronia pacifica]ODA34029.1 phage tail protein [Veronia pacifica]